MISSKKRKNKIKPIYFRKNWEHYNYALRIIFADEIADEEIKKWKPELVDVS